MIERQLARKWDTRIRVSYAEPEKSVDDTRHAEKSVDDKRVLVARNDVYVHTYISCTSGGYKQTFVRLMLFSTLSEITRIKRSPRFRSNDLSHRHLYPGI